MCDYGVGTNITPKELEKIKYYKTFLAVNDEKGLASKQLKECYTDKKTMIIFRIVVINSCR